MKKYYVVIVQGHDELDKVCRFRLPAILHYNKMARKGYNVKMLYQDWTLSAYAWVERSTTR